MVNLLLDRFTNSATMMDAEEELMHLGSDAIPILASVLTGEATNDFGISYRSLGLPLRCALEVAVRLGPTARPLEALLRAELRNGNFVAAQALGKIEFVEDSSIEEPAAHLDYEVNRQRGTERAPDLTCESAVALLKLGQEAHPAVTAALKRSALAAADFNRVKVYLLREKQSKMGTI